MFATYGSMTTSVTDIDRGTTLSTTTIVYFRSTAYDVSHVEFSRELRQPHALPRAAQLERIREQVLGDLRRVSPLERSRFGWADAPRRPCYRSVRAR